MRSEHDGRRNALRGRDHRHDRKKKADAGEQGGARNRERPALRQADFVSEWLYETSSDIDVVSGKNGLQHPASQRWSAAWPCRFKREAPNFGSRATCARDAARAPRRFAEATPGRSHLSTAARKV